MPSFFYASLSLCLSCLPSAFVFVNITINCALDAGVLGLVIRVSEVFNFNIGVFFKASNSFFEASDCKISSFGVSSFLSSSFFEVGGSPLKTSESGIGSFRTPSFLSSSLFKVSGFFFKVALPYIRCLLRLL